MQITDNAFEAVLDEIEKEGVKPILDEKARKLIRQINEYFVHCYWHA